MITTRHKYEQISDTSSGVTVDAYATALDINCAGYEQKFILLKNTHLTASLTYKLDGYCVPGGILDSIISDTVLAPGEVDGICYLDPHSELILSVKSSVGSTPSSYRVDYSMA